MGPESVNLRDGAQTGQTAPPPDPSDGLALSRPEPNEFNWVFFGPRGLRAGWSIFLFAMVLYFTLDFFQWVLWFLVVEVAHLRVYYGTALNTLLLEGQRVAALLTTWMIVAALERRRLADYNLGGSRRLRLLLGGVAAGFGAVSVLILVLREGGWLHFGPGGLSGPQVVKYALLWGLAFLLVGIFEEGAFRCYLLATLERGLNFWWALALVGGTCVYLEIFPGAHGAWGVYAAALAGVVPCAWAAWRKTPRCGLWQAAWASSVGFGMIHTFNPGENWMGVLAAAFIGFIFCVSVGVTGSAWWAIGCHAAWDWSESYFYGTADSGFAARGHLLTTTPAGSALWSGGSDGPEGSVLVFPVILLLMFALIAIYARRKPAVFSQKNEDALV